MTSSQLTAVSKNMHKLCLALESTGESFFNFLQQHQMLTNGERDSICCYPLIGHRVMASINCLLAKEDGWNILLDYLRQHKYLSIATELLKCMGENPVETRSSLFNDFSLKLTHYYLQNYSHLATFGDCTQSLDDIWVPPKFVEKNSGTGLSLAKILFLLTCIKKHDVALIRGDVGIGKSILTKKLAYDWAKERRDEQSGLFELVLAVPLRSSMSKADSFAELAVSYFSDLIGVSEAHREELLREINQLKEKVLIILDGLDAYGSKIESPFSAHFGVQFQRSPPNSKHPVLFIPHKLIITSRPYAAVVVNPDFTPLRLDICAFSADQMREFVECQSSSLSDSEVKVILKLSDQFASNPLFITYLYYLIRSDCTISTDLTRLFENFLCESIRREKREGRLEKTVDMDNWMESNLVKKTAELAFIRLESGRSVLHRTLAVPNDCFICGFLQKQVSNSRGIHMMADFPHRPIQEFFAAIYCRQLIVSSAFDHFDRNVVMKKIGQNESLFGRFFLGLCSKYSIFDQMLEILRPSLADSLLISSATPIETFIQTISGGLSDCLDADCRKFGLQLAATVGQFELQLVDQRSWIWWPLGFVQTPMELKGELSAGLRLECGKNPNTNSIGPDWFILSAERDSADLAVVSGRPPADMMRKFNSIGLFVWLWTDCLPIDFSEQLETIAPVRTFVVRMTPVCLQEVNFRLEYDSITSSTLKNISFGLNVELHVWDALKDFSDPGWFEISPLSFLFKNEKVRWYHLKVTRLDVSQTEMIKRLCSLITIKLQQLHYCSINIVTRLLNQRLSFINCP